MEGLITTFSATLFAWFTKRAKSLYISYTRLPTNSVSFCVISTECNVLMVLQVFCDNYLDGGYHVPYAHKGLASSLKLDSYSIKVSYIWDCSFSTFFLFYFSVSLIENNIMILLFSVPRHMKKLASKVAVAPAIQRAAKMILTGLGPKPFMHLSTRILWLTGHSLLTLMYYFSPKSNCSLHLYLTILSFS